MTTNKPVHAQVYLKRCREEFQAVSSTGDQRKIAAAQANLGHALLAVGKNYEGDSQFDQAIKLTETLHDVELQIYCMGIKVSAYQSVGRLPDAYQTAVSIRELAEAQNDTGLKCDALLSQGHILLESGEPMMAMELFEAARDIALELEDKRRMMNVMGMMGNYALHMAVTDQALAYFQEARQLADMIGDKTSEMGFLGNEATLLAYNGRYAESAAAFETVLAYVTELGDQEAQLKALKRLVQINEKQENFEGVLALAQNGIDLAEGQKDKELLFDFYESFIAACYRLHRIEEAEAATEQAIAAAKASKDREKEVDFLLGLGESAMLFGMPEKALAAYTQAREGAVRLSRQYDEAYLTGRVGVALAEIGRTDEAIEFHKEAIALAQRREIPQLEGEQLSMLAMAYLEKKEMDAAKTNCQAAIEVFTRAELEADVNQARQLLEQIG